MALGSKIAGRSRKRDLIVMIQMARAFDGAKRYDEVVGSTAGYMRKTVAELEKIAKIERFRVELAKQKIQEQVERIEKEDRIKAYVKARDEKYEKYGCEGQYCEQYDGECEICADNRRG